MAGLTGKAAKRQAKILAKQLRCDVSRVYQHSKTMRPRRGQRKDSGAMRAIKPDSFEKLAAYTVKLDLSGPHIADISGANLLGEISAATYNRQLRQQGISRRNNKKDLLPYVRWQAKLSNQIHQIDSTVAQQFYLDDDGSIGYESTLTKNKNKPGNRKPRLHLLSLVDDFSRAIYARFTLGNHTFAWMEFLYEAWRKKDDDAGFPFHGLPKILYSDNDTVVKSGKFTHAMQALNVKIVTHKVGNPRAKGKVEGSFKLLQEFEKVTRVRNWQSLEEANADLFDYLYMCNNRKHSTTKQASFARWQSITAERLMEMPEQEIFRLLHIESQTRLINKNMTVKIEGKEWQLPFRSPFINHVGAKVEIYRMPGDFEKLWMILDGKEYEVLYCPTEIRAAGGQHEEMPKPRALQRREELQQTEEGELRLTGIYKERYRRPYMTKDGKEFEAARIAGEQPAPLMRTKLWFIQYCQEHLGFDGPPRQEEREWIADQFNEATEMNELTLLAAARRLQNGEVTIYRSQTAVAGE